MLQHAAALRAASALGPRTHRDLPVVAMQHLRRICTARSPQLRTCALPTWQQLKPCPLTQPQRPPSPAPRRTSASRARKLEKAMTTTPACTCHMSHVHVTCAYHVRAADAAKRKDHVRSHIARPVEAGAGGNADRAGALHAGEELRVWRLSGQRGLALGVAACFS